MIDSTKTNFVEVFNGDYWQGSVIQQLLLEYGIESFLKNKLMGSLEPFAVVAGGANPVSIDVLNEDYETAIRLIEEFNNASRDPEGQ